MQVPADLGRRDAFEQRHRQYLVAQPLEQLEVAATLAAKAELSACDHHASVRQLLAGELLRLLLCQLEREVEDGRLGHAELVQQLEPALERRDRLDEVAQHHAWVGIEREDPDRKPGAERSLDHLPMTEMDPVERPDRDCLAHGRSASASSAGITRSSSASSTLNGPTSSRRNVVQWPPSASAIART